MRKTALTAFALAALYYWLQGDLRLDWADEGFLWYGALHTRLGEVPIRDFQAYDPGRYYWCAAFSFIFGKGVLGMRAAASVFQAVALTFGLLALRRAVKNTAFWAGAGILSMFWMLWNFRYFDAGIPMMAVFFVLRLVEKSSPRRFFEAGAFGGLSLFFGLNHGLYVLLAVYLSMLYCEWKGLHDRRDARSRLWLGLGLGAGLLPLAGMWLFCPGFWESYWERFAFFGRALGTWTTNMGGTILWPWTLSWNLPSAGDPSYSIKVLTYLNIWAQGSAFFSVLLSCLFFGGAVLRMNKDEAAANALLPAGFFVGLFYLHHVFSRPDMTHLGEGIFPFLAAAFAFPGALKKKGIGRAWAGWLAVLTLLAAMPLGNLFFWTLVPKEKMVSYPIGNERIRIFRRDAELMEGIKRTVAQHVAPQEPLFLAPILTTVYCVLERKAPAYEIYLLLPPSQKVERRVIDELERKKVRWALVSPAWVYGREDLALPATHPALWAYLAERYEVVSREGLPPGYALVRRKA